VKVAIDAHMVGERETGNETYVVNLLRGLAELPGDDRFSVLTPHPDRLRGIVSLPARFEVMRVWPATSVLRIPFATPIAVRRARVDLLHMTYITPPRAGCPTVVTVHDLSFLEYPRAFSWRVRTLLRTLVPGSIARAARVITDAEFTKQDIVRRYGVAPEKIIVTHLAPAPGFSRLPKPLDAPLPPGVSEPYVLAVGNLEPRKNLVRLLEAFAVVVTERRFAGSLVLVGQAAMGSATLRRLARLRGIESRVIFAGFVTQPELNALYNRAAVFVYPSLYEGFGLPAIEAMACGCPVVASNVSALPETTGGAAMLVDPLSTAAIADAISAVLERPELARQLRERGLRQAASYSWAATAARTLGVYADSLAVERPPVT
jgi:glycosyltransferase involved in cell wall biosynthesis